MDEEDVTMEEPAPEVAADASEKAPAAPDTSGRAAIVADFIRNAPPGGRDEVYNDIRVLLGDDDDLDAEILEALAHYNKEQLAIAKVEGLDHGVILSDYNEMEDGRFMDPKSRTTFAFDHLLQTASDIQTPAEGEDEPDAARDAVDGAIEDYVKDHFANGAWAVYPCDDEFVIAIVDNKYNPSNYWNGRWRSTWQLHRENATKLQGKLQVHVHYYEDGNVQLETSREVEVDFKAPSDAAQLGKALAKAIHTSETEFQTSLNDACAQLSDTTFKTLRRALPVTRNKIEWTKLGGYQIGAEAAKK